MVEFLVSVVNLTSFWFYFSLALTSAMLVVWRFMIIDFDTSPALFAKLITFVFFVILFVADKAAFIVAVTTQPRLDFGVALAVLGPLVMFFFHAWRFAQELWGALRRGWFSAEAAAAYLPALRRLNRLQMTFAFAWSSIGGVLLALVNTGLVRVQERLIPVSARRAERRSRRARYKDE
jgi:hypothetical protein